MSIDWWQNYSQNFFVYTINAWRNEFITDDQMKQGQFRSFNDLYREEIINLNQHLHKISNNARFKVLEINNFQSSCQSEIMEQKLRTDCVKDRCTCEGEESPFPGI